MSSAKVIYSAVKIISCVEQGSSLNTLIPQNEKKLHKNDQPMLRQILYGTLRHYFSLDFICKKLLRKSFKKSDNNLKILIIIGIYLLEFSRIPSHAAVKNTVDTLKLIKKDWAKGVINAVLRGFIRQREGLKNSIKGDMVSLYEHPEWFISLCRDNWKDQWREILLANNTQSPLTLRINTQKTKRKDYIELLEKSKISAHATEFSSDGITLDKACAVDILPGFLEGYVSVQDEAAQLSAELMACRPGERILDACSAPGGKMCHLLEKTQDINIHAIDIDDKRLTKIEQNLKRLNQKATLICANALDTDKWWDKKFYDRILLDAPCSATGVIRRHPDIKHLRRNSDVEKLAEIQQSLLSKMWSLLKPGGRLVYATCSVLAIENCEQIKRFLVKHSNASIMQIDEKFDPFKTEYGIQLLPTINKYDGFFYSVLKKNKYE